MFIGAVGKSPIPLHVWLPDAMEGPTRFQHNSRSYNGIQDFTFAECSHSSAQKLHNDLVDLAFIIALIGGITVVSGSNCLCQRFKEGSSIYNESASYIFTGLGCAMFLANTLDWHNDDGAITSL